MLGIILEQKDLPGWLHPIILGATTIPENWNAFDVFRDSFNHYSFGSVCQFFFEYIGGIRPKFEAPGFKEFELKPVVGGSLTWAEATYKTQYGTIISRWEKREESFVYFCEIPHGSKAHLTLPCGRKEVLTGGVYNFKISI